jgi:hypothetical protein
MVYLPGSSLPSYPLHRNETILQHDLEFSERFSFKGSLFYFVEESIIFICAVSESKKMLRSFILTKVKGSADNRSSLISIRRFALASK